MNREMLAYHARCCRRINELTQDWDAALRLAVIRSPETIEAIKGIDNAGLMGDAEAFRKACQHWGHTVLALGKALSKEQGPSNVLRDEDAGLPRDH